MSTSVWNRILENANLGLQEKILQAAILVIADAVLSRDGIKPDLEFEVDEEYLGERDGIIGDWMQESIPQGHALISYLGGTEFFSGDGSSWNERLCLCGDACPCIDDLYQSLYSRSDGHPDADQDVSKEMLEDFYSDWRAYFLSRVAKEAKQA